MDNFAERLQEQMYEYKLTAEKLGKELSISDSNISKWLRNKSIPNLESLIILSDRFKCSIDFLAGRSLENYLTPPKSENSFIDRLHSVIVKAGISNNRFAKNSKIPGTSLHHWLTKRSEPLLDNLIKIADYLDCTIDWLVGRE